MKKQLRFSELLFCLTCQLFLLSSAYVKIFILFNLIILNSSLAFSQNNRLEASKSNIYVNADYKNGINTFKFIAIKDFVKDTVVNLPPFSIPVKKFKWTTFTDYAKEKEATFGYETSQNNRLLLLDKQLQTIHDLNFKKEDEQTGIIAGTKGRIRLEFLDPRNSFPKDALIPDEKTPRKYFLVTDTSKYVVILPDLQVVAISNNGVNYTKYLMGDLFYNISKGLKNTDPIKTQLNFKPGDELQLFYRRKWYNDSTTLAEYEDKQFSTFHFRGDTIVKGQKAKNFEVTGYNYLSGKSDEAKFAMIESDSGYHIGQQFTPIKAYGPELKIIEHANKPNYFFLQAYVYDSVGSTPFPKVIQFYSPSPYRNFILPFFPVPFIEFGNVEGLVTYVKQDGKEHGQKKVKTEITDKTHIRRINVLSNKEIELEVFIHEFSEVAFKFYRSENSLKTLKKTTLAEGFHKVKLRSPKMKNGNTYQIQLEQRAGNNFNSIMHQFEARFN